MAAKVIDLADVQNLLAAWWFEYDQGWFDRWESRFTDDARFTCRSDSGATAFEEFIRVELSGRDSVLAWQEDHRRNSPYPLRHNVTNVHLVDRRPFEADFRSYLFVTQVVGGSVANLASGCCTGTVRWEDDQVRFAELLVVLDFTDSVLFSDALKFDVG